MALPCGIEYQVVSLIWVFSIYVILNLAIQFARRIPEAGFVSGTTGMFLTFVGLAGFQLGGFLAEFFLEDPMLQYITRMSGMFLFGFGMAAHVVITEVDLVRHERKNAGAPDSTIEEKFPYKISIITIVGGILFGSIGFIFNWDVSLLFFFLVVPFIWSSSLFLKQFEMLLLVRKENPEQWFFIGLSLAGFSNFLGFLVFFIGIWTYAIIGFCVLVGGYCMSYGWRRLPSLTELNWLRQLVLLMIIEHNSSIPVYSYEFIARENDPDSDARTTLAAGGLSGISSLLQEILSSKGNIKEIDHEEQKILFVHGEKTISVLIVRGENPQHRYRLELFGVTFEQEFRDQIKNWTGNVTGFRPAEKIVRQYFSR